MHTRLVIPVIAVSLALSACPGQDSAPSREPIHAPKIVCTQPHVHFGDVVENEELATIWEIGNAGSANLDITSVRVKFGHGTSDRQKLQPGETCLVSLSKVVLPDRFSRALPQSYTTTATVTTNDPSTPHFVLSVSARVIPPVAPAVTEIDFGLLRKGAVAEPRTFDVLSRCGGRIVDVGTDDPRVMASFEPLEKGRGWRITAKIPGGQPVGQLHATILIETTTEWRKTIKIPVRVRVEPEVRVEPRVFNFGRVSREEFPASRIIEIEKTGLPDLIIEGVEVHPKTSFSARIEEVDAGRRYRLIVSFVPEGAAAYSRAIVTIKTNCSGETEVPLYCYALIDRP